MIAPEALAELLLLSESTARVPRHGKSAYAQQLRDACFSSARGLPAHLTHREALVTHCF